MLFFFNFIAWLIQWSLALALFLIVIVLSGYYVYNHTLKGERYVVVPKITDMHVMDAQIKLFDVGLELGPYSPVPHETIPKYHVISQRPEAGKVVRSGRKVYPTVSAGPPMNKVLDLRGKTLEEAQKIIETDGTFRIGNIARLKYNAPPETVISQDPAPNTHSPPGTLINILVSKGETVETIIMPNIIGKTVKEAEEILNQFELKLVPYIVEMPDAPPDVVLEQNPPPDTPVSKGQTVIYTVKASGSASLPDARYQAEIVYVVEDDWATKEVRVELIDRNGNREVIWSKPRMYDTLSQLRYVKGTPINIKVTYIGKARVEIYIDNLLTASYEVEGGNPPKLTTN
ncbi:MAG: PASTA domain-containing protein [Candidatus Hydrogenedentes bacterium]|nr:PASTA domain-containing protein [Candidatus Hydrogenedentota bacterium]